LIIAKLILLPALALAAVVYLKLSFLFGFLIVLEAAVPSATTLSIMARHYKGNEQWLNQGIFFSHIAGIVTMPVFLMLYMYFVRSM